MLEDSNRAVDPLLPPTNSRSDTLRNSVKSDPPVVNNEVIEKNSLR